MENNELSVRDRLNLMRSACDAWDSGEQYKTPLDLYRAMLDEIMGTGSPISGSSLFAAGYGMAESKVSSDGPGLDLPPANPSEAPE